MHTNNQCHDNQLENNNQRINEQDHEPLLQKKAENKKKTVNKSIDYS